MSSYTWAWCAFTLPLLLSSSITARELFCLRFCHFRFSIDCASFAIFAFSDMAPSLLYLPMLDSVATPPNKRCVLCVFQSSSAPCLAHNRYPLLFVFLFYSCLVPFRLEWLHFLCALRLRRLAYLSVSQACWCSLSASWFSLSLQPFVFIT